MPATALGQIGDVQAVDALTKLTRSSFLKSRVAAVRALARWASRSDVRDTLLEALRDRNTLVRESALEVLATTGAEAKPAR